MEPALDNTTMIVVCLCLIAYWAIFDKSGLASMIPIIILGGLFFIGLPLMLFLSALWIVYNVGLKLIAFF